jgi:hypothetical protein
MNSDQGTRIVPAVHRLLLEVRPLDRRVQDPLAGTLLILIDIPRC